MKIKVYKMYFFCDDSAETPRYIFEQTDLYSEKGLKTRLKQAVIDEQLNDSTMIEYNLYDITDQAIDKMTTADIIEIFEFDGYDIQEQEIEI